MSKSIEQASTTKLRVWHIPQIPGPAFYVPVETPLEAITLLNILWNYDLFQFQNRIKPDYSNASGLEYFNEESSEWEDWHDPVDDVDICELIRMKDDSDLSLSEFLAEHGI